MDKWMWCIYSEILIRKKRANYLFMKQTKIHEKIKPQKYVEQKKK